MELSLRIAPAERGTFMCEHNAEWLVVSVKIWKCACVCLCSVSALANAGRMPAPQRDNVREQENWNEDNKVLIIFTIFFFSRIVARFVIFLLLLASSSSLSSFTQCAIAAWWSFLLQLVFFLPSAYAIDDWLVDWRTCCGTRNVPG